MKIQDFTQFDTYKFGGSSLADASCFQRVAQLVSNQSVVIVVSAVSGTTSQLQNCITYAQQQQDFKPLLNALIDKHLTIIDTLLADTPQLHQKIQQDIDKIEALLSAISIVKTAESSQTEWILGHGEIWSAQILTTYLQQTSHSIAHIDARDVLIINNEQQPIIVDWHNSEQALSQKLAAIDNISQIVLPGFIASNQTQQNCILGMNCSDYSAAIFAKLFQTQSLVIWTDVDGIMSADPNQVPAAFTLPYLSYKEALELAYFGASVIHPQAIAPAMACSIPIVIKNTFNANHPGTTIAKRTTPAKSIIKGLSSIKDIALIAIEGAGMIGVSGIAAKAFSALQHHNISVILISQASSEYSICLAVESHQTKAAQQALQQAFSAELHANHIERIKCELDHTIIAAVGDGMVGHTGISGKICQSLANSDINIHAIAQGGSERNVSLVVKKSDQTKALRVLHSAFHLSHKRITIAIIGPGTIGSCLLKQIAQTQQNLLDSQQLEIQCLAIMNSKKMILQDQSIELDDWPTQLNTDGKPADIEALINFILQHETPRKVIIDTTANPAIADHYQHWLKQGLHIITPNKFANSGDINYYQALRQTLANTHQHYYYETTVCAGLPVISTIQDLLHTGDQILCIEGVFSGTLSFVFDQLKQGVAFSNAIQLAHQKGYTEPDPCEDLSGMDVARKTICLAREAGLMISAADFNVTSLVPDTLQNCSTDQFMAQLAIYDTEITQSLNQKRQNQTDVLQYVGKIDFEQSLASVGIAAYNNSHPIANLRGTDNIVIIKTKRYYDQPLVIQGPGAGPEVTASGVFADLLRLAARI